MPTINNRNEPYLKNSISETLVDLVPELYADLIRIAAYFSRAKRADPLMEPSDLVHETYLRLAQHGPDRYVNRAQFFYVAVRQMHQILIDDLRARQAQKRGGHWQRVSFDQLPVAVPEQHTDPNILAIDATVARFQETDPQLGKVAELRLFWDLSSKEIARSCGIGESTARKKWRCARLRIQEELADMRRSPKTFAGLQPTTHDKKSSQRAQFMARFSPEELACEI